MQVDVEVAHGTIERVDANGGVFGLPVGLDD